MVSSSRPQRARSAPAARSLTRARSSVRLRSLACCALCSLPLRAARCTRLCFFFPRVGGCWGCWGGCCGEAVDPDASLDTTTGEAVPLVQLAFKAWTRTKTADGVALVQTLLERGASADARASPSFNGGMPLIWQALQASRVMGWSSSSQTHASHAARRSTAWSSSAPSGSGYSG